VSTAYCNCDRTDVDELIYPAPHCPEQIISCTSWMDNGLVEELTPKLIANRPNTYTFTKALAESMLQTESGSLPVAIVRPSIVLSSFREPIAGWVDNWNGPTGIIAAAGKGFFRYRSVKRLRPAFFLYFLQPHFTKKPSILWLKNVYKVSQELC
jgi:fatty acyl-CoA reductase